MGLVMNRLKKIPFFYGWLVVAIAFLNLAVGYGTRASFSVLLVALLEKFEWRRGAISGAFSLHSVVAGAGLPLIGAIVDRYGPRILFPTGIAIMAFAIWQIGSIQDLWHFYLYYGLILAFGRIMISMTPHSAILANWFKKKRGAAVGLASAGIAFGAVLLVPSFQFALSRFGLQDGCAIVAATIFLLFFPLNAYFPRLKPADMGLAPDGERPLESSSGKEGRKWDLPDASDDQTWTVRDALKTRRYWLLYSAFLLGSMVTMVDMHEIAYLVDAGYGKAEAAMIFASVSLVQSFGTVCWGALSDRIGRENSYTLGVIFLIAGISTLLAIKGSSQSLWLVIFVICYGLGRGVNDSLMPSITADVFHGKRVGSIYGTLATGLTFGAAFGPWLAGYLFDKNGNYFMPFMIAIMSFCLGCIMIWLAAPGKVRKK